MHVLILGGAGELGSNFGNLCLSKGHTVSMVDIVRIHEAWRLKELNIDEKVNYSWKSTFDLTRDDFHGIDLVLDCACQADRPLGTSAPTYTLIENLLGPLHVLETLRQYYHADIPKPFILYPSSSVEFLGVPKEEQPLTEYTIPKPTNVYGYTKWAAEELYRTYNRAFEIPCLIIRTGSCYGPMMRTDQFIAKCIIKALKNQDIMVKSPQASRTYTFTGDVLEFYSLFLEKFEKDPKMFDGKILANGGNADETCFTTWDVAVLIRELTNSKSDLTSASYESGELVNGNPVYQCEKSVVSEKLLGWKPKYTLKEGLKQTIEWFRGKAY